MENRQKSKQQDPELASIDDFVAQHQAVYDAVVAVLTDAVSQGDWRGLSIHISVFKRILETGINLALVHNSMNGAAGNA